MSLFVYATRKPSYPSGKKRKEALLQNPTWYFYERSEKGLAVVVIHSLWTRTHSMGQPDGAQVFSAEPGWSLGAFSTQSCVLLAVSLVAAVVVGAQWWCHVLAGCGRALSVTSVLLYSSVVVQLKHSLSSRAIRVRPGWATGLMFCHLLDIFSPTMGNPPSLSDWMAVCSQIKRA